MKQPAIAAPWHLDIGTTFVAVHTADLARTVHMNTNPEADRPTAEAIARLIAAAPDLLAALQALTALSHLIPQPANHDGLQFADALAAAHAAVAAATGHRHD